MYGFSAIELLLALSIVALTFTAGLLLLMGLPASIADGHTEVLGAWRAESALMETIRANAQGISGISSISSTTADGYSQSFSTEILSDPFMKELVEEISWIDQHGIRRTFSFSSFLAALVDPDSLSSCDQSLEGNWKAPSSSVFTFASGSLLPGDAASTAHPVTGLAVSSTTLAATVDESINKTDPTLFLFDISSSTLSSTNPAVPIYLGSIDNAPSAKHGIAALALSGNYAYAADAVEPNFATCTAGPACAQLQVFDISDRTNPRLIASMKLPVTVLPFATGSGGQSSGKSIAYADGRVYLGLAKTGSSQGEEFNIIDVRNPAAPVWLGGYSVGRSVTSILVRGPYAYITTDDTTRELLLLDIHDPAHISLIGQYNAPGNSIYGYGSNLSLASTTLLLTRTYTPNQDEFSLVSIASMTTPAFVGGTEIGTTSLPYSIEGALARDTVAFVLTDLSLDFWDISNPQHPVPYRNPIPTPFQSTSTALVCYRNTVYASSAGGDGTGYLTILTGS